MEQKRRSLLTYALVSKSLTDQNDIVLGLIPLFQPIVKELSGRIFDPKEFARRVKDYYDLDITAEIAEEIKPRLHKTGFLTTLPPIAKRGEYVYVSPSVTSNEVEVGDTVAKSLDEILNSFSDFCNNFESIFAVGRSKEELGNILFDWLLDKFKPLSDALTSMGYNGNGARPSADERANQRRYSSEIDYICSRFIIELEHKNRVLYDYVASISTGIMVSEIIIDLRKPPEASKKARELSVFIDAPFLMDALDLTGGERSENAKFIIERLKKLDVSLHVFDFYRDEIVENLKAVLGRHPISRTGPTADGLRAGTVREDYVKAVMNSVDYHLDNLGVKVLKSGATQSVQEVSFFPREMEDDFFAELSGWGHPAARERDTKAITFILRRRRDLRTQDVFSSKIVLLSHNPVLCRKALDFCVRHHLLSSRHVGPAIHQSRLAAMLWLTLGSEERTLLSRRQLVANCARAVASRGDVVDAILETLKSVKPEHRAQVEAVLSMPRGMQLAMDLVLADPANVTSATVGAIADLMVKEISDAERQRYEQQIKDQHSRLRRTIDDREVQIRDAQREIERLKLSESDARSKERQLFESYVSTIHKRMGILDLSLKVLLCASVIIVVSWYLYFMHTPDELKTYALPGFAVAATILALTKWPFRYPSIRRRLFKMADKQLNRKLAFFQLDGLAIYADIDWNTGKVAWRGIYDPNAPTTGTLI